MYDKILKVKSSCLQDENLTFDILIIKAVQKGMVIEFVQEQSLKIKLKQVFNNKYLYYLHFVLYVFEF